LSITIKNITKIYGEQKAVDDISFMINKGEVVGFLGPNGAGKSTTMKILTGYLHQDMGEAYVAGINVREQPLESKKKIGYLPEANPLYFEMYVREYLGFIADVHSISNKKQRIEEVIQMVGLTPESRKKIGQLSKGYKQRVGLAAALLHDPEVLILDEPTTGLDPNQIIEIREVIRSLGKDKTVLFSSHILQEVEAICDRVIIINKGKLVADNSISKLRDNTASASQVQVQYREDIDISMLSGLTGIETIAKTAVGNFSITTAYPQAMRRQLLEHSLLHNLNIVSLHSGETSLEDIFKELTSKK
jgi:ABC-2 type transport system ATP-binding protein